MFLFLTICMKTKDIYSSYTLEKEKGENMVSKEMKIKFMKEAKVISAISVMMLGVTLFKHLPDYWNVIGGVVLIVGIKMFIYFEGSNIYVYSQEVQLNCKNEVK